MQWYQNSPICKAISTWQEKLDPCCQNLIKHNLRVSPAKVAELEHGGFWIQQQILWLDVPMTDPERMDVCQTPKQLVHVQLHTEKHARVIEQLRKTASSALITGAQSGSSHSRIKHIIFYQHTPEACLKGPGEIKWNMFFAASICTQIQTETGDFGGVCMQTKQILLFLKHDCVFSNQSPLLNQHRIQNKSM